MSDPKPGETPSSQQGFAVVLVVIGVVFIGLSILWPRVSRPDANWPAEKAREYQAASSKLHSLSQQSVRLPPEEQTRALRDELADAQARYTELRSELDGVRDRPGRIASVLQWIGAALAVAGVLAFFGPRLKSG